MIEDLAQSDDALDWWRRLTDADRAAWRQQATALLGSPLRSAVFGLGKADAGLTCGASRKCALRGILAKVTVSP